MTDVVRTSRKAVVVNELDGVVELLVSVEDVTNFHRFTASEAVDIGIALQRLGEQVLRG